MIANRDLVKEYQLITEIIALQKFEEKDDFDNIFIKLEKITNLAIELNWNRSLKLLSDVRTQIIQKQAEFTHQQSLPTVVTAIKYMNTGMDHVEEGKFSEALELANKALDIYTRLNLQEDVRKVKQEIMRWSKMQEKAAASEPDDFSGLSEEEKRRRITEERRRRRREARDQID